MGDGQEGGNAAANLHGRHQDGASDQPKSGMENLKQGGRLGVDEDLLKVGESVNSGQGAGQRIESREETLKHRRQGRVEDGRPSRAARQVIADQVQVFR